MANAIEVRSDGEMLVNKLPIGSIQWQTPWPHEFTGEWFKDDPDEELIELVREAESEAKSEEDRADEAEHERDEALEDMKKAQSDLSHLCDEVRAFLAGEDCSKEALERLQAALEASE